MFTYRNGRIRTSVRNLVEFLLREGDIRSQGSLVADVETMQAGSRIHRKIQREQRITYQAEVPLKTEWPMEGYQLILEGRADGIDHTGYGSFRENEQITMESYLNADDAGDRKPDEVLYYIDEIKGVYQNVMEFTEAKPLHLAQAKCYAAMYLMREELDLIGVQITYCNMDTQEIKRFRSIHERQELTEWFLRLTDTYKMWADSYYHARKLRQETIKDLVFPYSYREGQKKLVAMVYHSILQKKKAFFQAPTGIGKTISAIYPSLKALSENKAEEVYYLTAKTITRTVAEDTLHFLKQQGLRMKSVTLTAKERICFQEEPECNPGTCDYAEGHFDRINDALYDMLTSEDAITREVVIRYSRKHMVCPYQLGLEASAFSDLVICDYNYVFDPHVNRTYVGRESGGNPRILLIDEAHNLVERARSMYSADLIEQDLIMLKTWIPDPEKNLHKKLRACRRKVSEIKKEFRNAAGDIGKTRSEYYMEMEDVDRIYLPLTRFLDELQEYLTDHPDFEDREWIVEVFFRLRHFLGILDTMTEGYRIYGMWSSQGFTIRLFCIDPSAQLKTILEGNCSAIFFSATLLPMAYYRNLLYGEEAEAFAIPSPFEGKRRLICISNDVTSRYSRRNREEYRKILAYLKTSIEVRKGNYMVFFPSYEMMEHTLELVKEDLTDLSEILIQNPSMGEEEKEEFLSYFCKEREDSLVGFCVLGSIFSEGIDLLGNRLIGVLIVGTGLPGIGMERDIIQEYFDRHGKKGYDYAYRFPGMNKVLQAAGRVIRSAQDVGVITLLDERFLWRENQYLLPEDWDRYYEVNLTNYGQVLRDFWGKAEESGFFDPEDPQ